MKSNTGIHVTVFSTFFLLIACAPMTALSSTQSSENNHVAVAKRYEDLAAEMQNKAQEQKEILNKKPRTSYFGRNGQHIKKRVAKRIRSFEEAAKLNLAKAADHRRIAQELAKQNNYSTRSGNEQIEKARFKSNSSSSEKRSDFKESL